METYLPQQRLADLVARVFALLEEKHIEEEGIYRLPGTKEAIDNLVARVSRFEPVELESESASTLCSFVKQLFRMSQVSNLPPAIFLLAPGTMGALRITYQLKRSGQEYKAQLNEILGSIEKQRLALLRLLVGHLRRVAEVKSNMMSLKALSICWGPSCLYTADIRDYQFDTDPANVLLMILEDFSLADQ